MPIAPKSSDANNAQGDGKLIRHGMQLCVSARRRPFQRRRARSRDSNRAQSEVRIATSESAALQLSANLTARICGAVNVDVQITRLVGRELLLGQLGIGGRSEGVIAGLRERNDHRTV